MKSRIIAITLTLAALIVTGRVSATVTSQVWFHFGDGGTAVQTDSSGNGRNFQNSYFAGTPPLAGANAVGGVLGNSGYTSTNSMRFGLNGFVTELYNTGYTPPSTNYGIEIWFLPQNKGIVTDNTQDPVAWLFSSGGSIFGLGPGGGAAIRVKDNGDGTSSLQAGVVQQGNSVNVVDFGPLVLADTNRWIHLALVNDNGSLVFYTNAVPCATNDITLTDPAGAMFIGRDGGHVSIDGFLDEARVFTFAPGQFTTSDLLYHASPRPISQPANTTVWNGGAANFAANISQDPANTFQWYRGTTALSGQTSASLNLPTVALTDSGSLFDCAVTNNSVGFVTSNSTLTVVPVQTANVAAYRNAVTSEPSLIAYFPVDGSTGATVANTVDGAHNGSLELAALYDGQTNRAFGERAIFLRGGGDVRIPANSAYEFGSGNGTLEALIYLAAAPGGGNDWIFSVASDDGSAIRYAVGISGDGTSLLYTNDSGVSLSWPVPVNLLNRFAHFALTFSGGTTLTAYLDGQSLGAKTQTGFGSASGVPAWIGSVTTNALGLFNGTIDELAVYSSTLSGNTIAIHNANFIFGTNTTAPVILSQSPSKTVYAGGSPVLSVAVSGTPPLSYQWRSNGVLVAGATSSSLTLSHVSAGAAAYTVFVTNPLGATNNTSTPINLTVIASPDSYSTAVMKDNPSAYWRLDESSGTNLTDYAGELDGSYSGTFTLGAPGITSDSAVSFGGGNGAVPYSSVLNSSGPFTVEFWANPTAAATYVPISSQLRSGSSRFGFIVYQFNGGSGWTVQMGNASGVTVQIIGATPIVAGNWYHAAITYDGNSNLVLYTFGYIDGTSSNAGNGNFIPNPSAPFEIGVRNGGAFPYLGRIDEVVFYNYALSQNQLQSHVGIGLPLKLAITPSTSVIADSKPGSPPYDGLDRGAVWAASDSDGTTVRSGVMNFTSTNNTQITDFGYSDFNSTNGTIMFWMRSAAVDTSSGNEGAILFNWRPSGGQGGIAFIQHDAGTFFVQAMNNYNHFDSVANVTDGKWHHCAVTYDQSVSGSVSLYVDGALDTTAPNANAWFWPSGQTVELGRDNLYDGGYWRNYTGSMDDFRIYNRILTPTEIGQALGGAVVDAGALKLRFNFDGPPNGYVVTWPYGSLQSAPLVTGPYSTVTNVPSPFPIAPASNPQKYFRGLR
jgi:hypothetical protein